MTEVFDIAVLGAGPAGMAAATLAARAGARVALLDENAVPGGQVYRAPAADLAAPQGPERREGDRMRAELAASGAIVHAGCRVWGVGGGTLVPAGAEPVAFRLDAMTDGRVFSVAARALILCTGTHERVIPFAGWTLPGVMGLAAATIPLKAQATLPGKRVVVAGSGPLLAAVAAGVLKAGGGVAAVVDLASAGAWMRALPALATQPRLLARGLRWIAALRLAGVPWLHGHRVVSAEGVDEVNEVTVAPLAGGPSRVFACDALCVGHGLTPATEAARVLKAAMDYAAPRGGWVPSLDGSRRTSVRFLYAAGDGAGVAGAAAAPLTGRLAALAALGDLGLLTPGDAEARMAAQRAELASAARFGAAMARMIAPIDGLVAAIPADCVVCRCEDVTRAEIEAALDAGARDVNQLKQFTRCGMGPCQGRMCGEAAAELVGLRVGGRVAAGAHTGRIPLRPVPMAALLGAFDYADIPVPAPAPI
jgi:thioredoxin reductase/bacterioferritin-associated ferredoxin